MKVKVLGEYLANLIIHGDDYVEVDATDFYLIGKTKKYGGEYNDIQYLLGGTIKKNDFIADGTIIDMTPQEIADAQQKKAALEAKAALQAQVGVLKSQLSAMDYKTSKYADGEYTQQEWTAVVTERKAIRAQIRQLGG